MSDPNLKAMTQAELFKYLEEDFMPRLLPKLANVRNIEAENARLKAENERLRKAGDAMAETILKDCIHKNDMAALKWYAANREQGCLVNPIKVAQYLPKPPAKEGKQS